MVVSRRIKDRSLARSEQLVSGFLKGLLSNQFFDRCNQVFWLKEMESHLFQSSAFSRLGNWRVAFSALARVSPTTILEDATVPRSELADMVRFIQQTAAKYAVRVGTFGHMGDGNLHPTFLTDEKNTAEMARVEKAMTEIFDHAVALGGTITGEHGLGLAKKAFLPKAIGDASLETMVC